MYNGNDVYGLWSRNIKAKEKKEINTKNKTELFIKNNSDVIFKSGKYISAKNSDATVPNAMDTVSTKQKIINNAAALFAAKGFTETSIRELAAASGLQGSSIYNHFQSKNAILEYLLYDYAQINSGAFTYETALPILEDNPTIEGALSCLQLCFPDEKADYYFNVLSMTLQEQHRNPIVREFIKTNYIDHELHTKTIIDVLKDLKVIEKDAEPDFWAKLVSSIFYAYSSRSVLGIGDRSQGYEGMDMTALLAQVFTLMFEKCGIKKGKRA